ncbi:hypothetical protein OPT61_g125 [Boeremia exigua]|uniref:Uncharacterized protein n=1 Tax=Boeremia exigua TaxID=749465 RepID=A0ACC2IVA4_9PLEO|nr:hypothetical protein OPT61_g125 [Boeremia exigua]
MDSDIVKVEEFPAYLSTQKSLTRYNPAFEKKPNHAWYQMDKTTIDGLLRDFSQTIVTMLNGSPDDDSELQHLFRTATVLANVSRSPPVRVALIGAQGAGKSLSINALFDCDVLSLTGADGAACTSSITRYVHYNGEYRFSAEIKFLTAGKREALLQEHARNLFHYQHADVDSDDEDAPLARPTRRDELERRLKDTAEDIFLTLFGDRDTFQESWSASSYKSGEFVNECQLKCEEALWREGGGSGVAIKFADDQKDLIKQLRPFITEVKGVTCLWPFVDQITIKFNNELLQSGIEIIDLPGWGDSNLARIRHAEEIKDTVDVEFILADIIRFASDDKVINSARAAVAHHGAANVKMVTTKIDAFSGNELSQCSGGIYDKIKQLIYNTEQQDAQLDDDDDEDTLKKKSICDKYKTYLDRLLKQTKVMERNDAMTTKLAAKLQGRRSHDMPQIFNTSAAEYMEWIKTSKINFKNQPSLPVEMTGIPAIRQFLYSLPAEQNVKDYENHILKVLPTFIEKIRHTVNDSERNADFKTIANGFDEICKAFMAHLLAEAKAAFQSLSDSSISRIQANVPALKDHVTELYMEDWNELKAAAFNRILKCRGTVAKDASKARGLENGANWNKDLANILTPSFHKWSNAYTERRKPIKPALECALDQLHTKVNSMMHTSTANLPTTEKAKKRWAPFRNKVRAKLIGLMNAIEQHQSKALEWATLAFNKENNLIANVTDDIYIEVFNTVPALKQPNPKAKKQYKQYVEPKLKFQKRKLADMLLHGDRHIVDMIINQFQAEFDRTTRQTLMEHFASIEKLLEDFSKSLRLCIPINYVLTAEGKAIRAEVEEQIPELEQKVEQLRALLPVRASQEENSIAIDNIDIKEEQGSLASIIETMAKRKPEPAAARRPAKKIKQEPF